MALEPEIYPTRIDMIRSLIKEGSKICEVGVFKGDMAKELEEILKPSLFVLIDLFEGKCGSGNQDGNNFMYVELDKAYIDLKSHFSNNANVNILKGDSVKNMGSYADETFDMIYIDGDHSYEGCKRDLQIAIKKIKTGGYLMGHDYEMNMEKAEHSYSFGVKRAVDTFCEIYGLEICAKGLDGCVSYAIKKK